MKEFFSKISGKMLSALDTRGVVIAAVLLALILRLTIVFLYPHTILGPGAFVEKSEQFARNYVDGKGFVILSDKYSAPGPKYAYGRPMYAFFLVAVYALFGQTPFAVGFCQALLSTVNVLLTYLAGRRAFGQRAGALAAIFIAFYPYFIFHDVHVNRTVLATFLNLAMVLFSLRLGERFKSWDALLLGIIVGCGTLTEGPALLAAPFIALWLAWRASWNIRIVVRPLILTAIGIVIPIAPWAIRNYMIFHRPVFICTEGGRALWKVHNPSSYHVLIDLDLGPDAIEGVEPDPLVRDGQQSLGEADRDDFYYAEAKKFIFTHLELTVKQTVLLFGHLWSILIMPPEPPALHEMFQNKRLQLLKEISYTASFAPLLLFAIAGGILSLYRRIPASFLLFGILTAGTIVGVVFSGMTRYRVPFDPLIAAFAGLAIASLLEKCSASYRRSSAN